MQGKLRAPVLVPAQISEREHGQDPNSTLCHSQGWGKGTFPSHPRRKGFFSSQGKGWQAEGSLPPLVIIISGLASIVHVNHPLCTLLYTFVTGIVAVSVRALICTVPKPGQYLSSGALSYPSISVYSGSRESNY